MARIRAIRQRTTHGGYAEGNSSPVRRLSLCLSLLTTTYMVNLAIAACITRSVMNGTLMARVPVPLSVILYQMTVSRRTRGPEGTILLSRRLTVVIEVRAGHIKSNGALIQDQDAFFHPGIDHYFVVMEEETYLHTYPHASLSQGPHVLDDRWANSWTVDILSDHPDPHVRREGGPLVSHGTFTPVLCMN